MKDEHIQKARDWFEKTGRWALLIEYFFPGIRHIVAFTAGASKLKLKVFAVFAYTGGFLWTGTFISTGYFFGKEYQVILFEIRRHLLIASIAGLLLISLSYYLRKKYYKSKRTPHH